MKYGALPPLYPTFLFLNLPLEECILRCKRAGVGNTAVSALITFPG